MKRSRGRGRRPSNPANRSYDSNGPDVRVRGTASQVYEKYQTLGRDAQLSGDRVGAENYMQHAEHYYRIQLSMQPVRPEVSNSDDEYDDNEDGLGQSEAVTEILNAQSEDGDLSDNDSSDDDNARDTGDDGHDDDSYEPLILTRDDNGQADGEEPRPAKTGRRRGPLRRRMTTKPDEKNTDAAAGE
jgi:hypothetical protein